MLRAPYVLVLHVVIVMDSATFLSMKYNTMRLSVPGSVCKGVSFSEARPSGPNRTFLNPVYILLSKTGIW